MHFKLKTINSRKYSYIIKNERINGKVVQTIRKSVLNRKGKDRKITPKGLTNRVVDAIPKQYRGLFDYSAAMDDGVLKLKFKLNTARETDYIKALGKAVISTDMADLTPRQIETDIKWPKNRMLIPFMPEHVWNDVKIREHVFLCVVGMLLYNYMLYMVGDPVLSVERLVAHPDQVKLGLVHGGAGADFVIEDMNRETAEVFSRLQLGESIPM